MHKGSCLCGSIKYEISGDLGSVFYCHCSSCRKANGSAFVAVTPIPASKFTIVKGQDLLCSYLSDSGIDRMFCGLCGSPIIAIRDSAPEIVRLRIGTLDTPIESKTAGHIIIDSKAEWYEIHDDFQNIP